MTENKRFVFTGISSGIKDNVEEEFYSCDKDGFQDVCDELNTLYEEICLLKKRNIELENKFIRFEEAWIDFEQIYYTEIYEPSEKYNEELLCEFSNIFFGGRINSQKE